MKKLLVFTVLVLAATASAAYCLILLGNIVQAMIVLAAVFTVVSLVYVYRKYIYTKSQVAEKKVISSTILETETQKMGGLVKCTHCNRVFSQPLRMLDFHSDRPRIINICPFCNEVIPQILRHEEERGKKLAPKGKKNNQTRKSQEKVQKEETKATEETVPTSA